MRTGKGSDLKRLIEKFGHGFSRLTFWRKPAEPNPENPEPGPSQAPAAASAPANLPVQRAGWFAHLKHRLQRWLKLADALPAESDQVTSTAHPASKRSDPDAPADDVPALKPSLLARLKNKLRRSPRPEPIAADADTSQSSLRQSRAATASSEAEPAAEEDAAHAGRIQRVRAVLSNKRVWIPGISVMLVAIFATMTGMLLQSGQEKKQLQIALVAAQQKLKQASTVQKVTLRPAAAKPAAPKQAGNPVVATAGDHAVGVKPGVEAGECEISNPKNVAEHLKNCIDSFNAMAN